MTHTIIVFILVLHELGTILVDRIVGQVHEQVFEVVILWGHIHLSSKPAEPFFIHINPQGINSAQEHVDSEIEFKSLNEEGFMEVPLDYIVVVRVHIIQRPSQEDASTLTGRFWFHDVCFCFFLLLFCVTLREL